jgi:predicted RNase H-like HicB family nuclease
MAPDPRFEVIIYWSDADGAFIAEAPELPGCVADGPTYQTAVANVEVVIGEWLASARETGRSIPEPKGRLQPAKAAPKPGYTELQGRYLAFIDAYTKMHRQPPAESDLQRHFGVTPPSIHQMILTLHRKGLIERTPGAARSIRVVLPADELPPLSTRTRF